MADYVSPLTGVQMDAALLDMAEHNSEAYAVGERNGIAVASDDVTYHNNARYYAQIASSQIVGDASSAVRWDTDQSEALTDAQKAQARENINAASDSDVVKITAQTLTSAEQAQARANIMAGGSNRNLLDNPFFTVNQRSATTLTLNGTEDYISDRWIVGAFGTYTHNSNHTITITCPNDTTYAGLTQRIDPVYKGGTYTYSIRLNDDTVISLQGTMPNGSGLNVYSITINNVSWQVLFRSDGSAYWVTLRCNVANTTITIKAVKLEPGSVSTLANDAPPDYGMEFLKCARYFVRLKGDPLGNGYIISSKASSRIALYTPVPMRAVPIIAINGSFHLRVRGGTLDVTTISPTTPQATGSNVVVAAGGFTAGEIGPCSLYADSGYIDLSADL